VPSLCAWFNLNAGFQKGREEIEHGLLVQAAKAFEKN